MSVQDKYSSKTPTKLSRTSSLSANSSFGAKELYTRFSKSLHSDAPKSC
jgi:hypothetical protein